jgi:hypothetical protein
MGTKPNLAPPPESGEINVELLPLSELPAASPNPPRREHRVIAVIAAVVGAALLAATAGLAWWFLG